MNKRITFRHMEHSSVMEDYINKNLDRIESFLSNERTPIYIDIVVTDGKLHAHHQVEMIVKTPNYEAFAKLEGPKAYQVIDAVINRVHEQLIEEKDKQVSIKKTGRQKE